MRFRKKPVVIDAIRYMSTLACEDLYEFAGISYRACDEPKPPPFRFSNGKIYIDTLEGVMTANQGDWIIKGVKGEFYPCKDDVFIATYEEVKE